MNKEKYSLTLRKYTWQLLGGAAFVALLVINAVHCREIEELKTKISSIENAVQPTYIYDVKKVIANSTELKSLQQRHVQQLEDLNNQLAEAKDKLEKMKDKKAKAEFSEVYLSALTLKRNTLIENYEKSINEFSERTTAALLKVVEDKNLSVVYDVKSIAVTTPNVIDITDEVLQNLQK